MTAGDRLIIFDGAPAAAIEDIKDNGSWTPQPRHRTCPRWFYADQNTIHRPRPPRQTACGVRNFRPDVLGFWGRLCWPNGHWCQWVRLLWRLRYPEQISRSDIGKSSLQFGNGSNTCFSMLLQKVNTPQAEPNCIRPLWFIRESPTTLLSLETLALPGSSILNCKEQLERHKSR